MNRFDTVLVVDWSGGNDTGPTPRKDAIWSAVGRAGVVDTPIYHRNRDIAMEWITGFLETEHGAGHRVLAGFDFPFGLPDGAARIITESDDPFALWDWLADHLPGTNRYQLAARMNACFPGHGPFWFNGSGKEIDGLPHLKSDRTPPFAVAETRAAEDAVPGAFSCWQLGGAGAVGSQALTGMACLATLRSAFGNAMSVWPFEAPDARIVLAEVYPSMLRDAVNASLQTDPDEIKDRAQVRLLARAVSRLAASGDLSRAFTGFPDTASREGWILGTGIEADLAHAARPDIAPPKLKDDCFALPAGVDWVPVDTALDLLRKGLAPVTATETVPVATALGRILAEDAVARRSNPPSANAAVDGYGFAHSATGPGPQILPLAQGRAAAGVPFKGSLPEGRALRILTGAPLPDGVDTVILEEDTTVGDGHIAFEGPVKPGANTRKAGEDVEEGGRALPAGRQLAPQDLALLSALGVAQARVYKPLKAAVLSTGDELLDPGAETAGPGKIFDANRPMLLALLDRWHHAPLDLGIAPDDEAAVIDALDRGAAGADVILTSGGASAGDEDHMSRILRERGKVTAWRIALKPGRPLMLGHWKGVPVIGMPGNPVAAFVCALIFARPALSLLAGGPWLTPAAELRPAAFSKNKKPGRREYLRARLDAAGAVEAFKSEGSGRISGLSWATGLVEIPDGPDVIAPGDPVRYMPFSGFGL